MLKGWGISGMPCIQRQETLAGEDGLQAMLIAMLRSCAFGGAPCEL